MASIGRVGTDRIGGSGRRPTAEITAPRWVQRFSTPVDVAVEIPDWRLTAAAQLWGSATTELQEQLSEATWNTWFRDVRAAGLDGEHLRLVTPHAVVCERIRSSYGSLITAAVNQVAGDEVVIDLTVESGPRFDEPVLLEPAGVTESAN